MHTRAVALVILDILHTLHEGLSFLRPLALTNQGKSADIELQVDTFIYYICMITTIDVIFTARRLPKICARDGQSPYRHEVRRGS